MGFRKIDEAYSALPIPDEVKQKFSKLRYDLNLFLDKFPTSRFTINNYRPTNREIMTIFIYGGLAHANPKMKKIFDQWKDTQIFEVIQNEFLNIITNVFRATIIGKNINKKALEKL